ncbi:hypothetical protein LIER_23358 [Lithospermum erythrorhizon]|uniref:Endonuclease/exonuclease/phosphatase n=1 Tax=Lithospermum erythrorhizon TaxID=34254 RepID=A0AAV3QYI2_LITER
MDEDVQIVQASEWYVDIRLNENAKRVWRGVFVYASCDDIIKTQLEVLRTLGPGDNEGWCILGDVNDILEQSEKSGGNVRAEGSMETFRGIVRDCELVDIGYVGYPFTWCNHKEGRI